jgi:hypothetical protein
MEASVTYPLRALTIGEIFDRAITIYVRHLVPLTLIVMTLIVPIQIVQGFLVRDQSQGLLAAIQQIEHPTKAAAPNYNFGLVFLVIGLSALLVPIVNDAVAVGVANIYNAKRPSYRAAFATVLPRVFPLIGTTILEALILLFTYLAFVVALSLIVVMGVAAVQGALPLAIVLFVIAGLVTLAVIVLFTALFIGFSFATYATVLENLSPASAVAGAFRRLFNRLEFKKVLLMGLSAFAVNIGVVLLSGTVTVLLELLVKSQVVDLAVGAVVQSVSTAFLTVLLAVYYYDVRTRSEGLDLEVDLARLTATP